MPYYPPANGTVTTSSVPTEKKVNQQTETSYTLKASDASSLITCDNKWPTIVTIPTNSDVDLPVGTVVELMQIGAGQVTISGPDVTIKSADDQRKLKAQYSQVTLLKTDKNTWVLTGNLTEAEPETTN